MGKARNAYRVEVAKPEGEITRGRHRRRWECSIQRDLKEIGWKGVDWIDLGQEAGCCEHGTMNHWGGGGAGFLDKLRNFRPFKRDSDPYSLVSKSVSHLVK